MTPIADAIARGRTADPRWKPCIFDQDLQPNGNHSDYWQGSAFMLDMFAAAYRRHLPKVCRGGLVDLGCGPAPLLSAYAQWVDWYYLVDWPSTFHENSAIDLPQDLNLRLELPDATFDTALLTSVLEHIRRPEALLHECARILKPGGRVFLQVPFAYWLHEEPFDYFRYTRHALTSLGQDAGLEIETIEAVGNDVDVLIDISAKRLCSSTNGLVRRAGRILQRRARSRSTRTPDLSGKVKLPLGYVVVARKHA